MSFDTRPEYWESYSNLQAVKHSLIRHYLSGWFPKLGFWNGRIAYLDTHAGRGKHETGDSGSPIVALQTFLSHTARDRILADCQVCFVFIEAEPRNAETLNREVAELGDLPTKVSVQISCEDCFTELEDLLEDLESKQQKIAPAFVFVDPYGFKVPGGILRRLLNAGNVEIFINIMWRELDMAMVQAATRDANGLKKTLDLIFDGEEWATLTSLATTDERADATIDFLRGLYGARWATSIRMLGSNQSTRYMLVHFTNHEAGRDLMKDCLWKVCPDGAFYARRSDNPKQILLIQPEPDFFKLDGWLMAKLVTRAHRWSELLDGLRGELWRDVQLNDIIRSRRRDGTIVATDYVGRFSGKANPLLSLLD